MADIYEIQDAEIIKETDLAFLVEAEEFDAAVWIPRSVCDLASSDIDGEGQSGNLVVKGSWARREGWV